MYCQNCGREIPDESVYCMWCGKPIAGRGGTENASMSADPYPSTEIERFYEEAMNHVRAIMKNPKDCTWPRYESSMRQEHKRKQYIVTYIDATNSFGGGLRCSIRIKLDKYPKYTGFGMKQPSDHFFISYK